MKTGIEFTPYQRTYGFEEGLKRMKSHGYDALDYQDFCHTENKIFHVSEEVCGGRDLHAASSKPIRR